MKSRTNQTYIVFIDLPDDISLLVSKIIENVSPSTPKLQPHITIKYDEELLAEEAKVIELLEKFTSSLSAFKIHLGELKINKSGKGFNVYIETLPKDKIVNLVKKISKLMEPLVDPNSPRAFESTRWEQSDEFYPHISIKGSSDKVGAESILNKARKYYKNEKPKFNLESIVLARFNKDRWETVKSFKIF